MSKEPISKGNGKAGRPGTGLRYYSVYQSPATIQACKEIAAAETRRLGFVIATAAIMRKFIEDGVVAYRTGKGISK